MADDQRFDAGGLELCCTVAPGPEMIDYNGHLNVAFYGALFEDAARSIFARIDISRAYRERTGAALFAAELHIVFHREVAEGEAVDILCRILDCDGRKLQVMFYMVRSRDGALAAAQEILYLHVDLAQRRVSPIPEPQAGRIRALLEAHRRLPPPADAGRSVALRRRPAVAPR
ncbi:MAG: thioesterase family protein [Dongiaceae bacterium]